MTYAKDTQVSSQKSRIEIENTLQRYGATGFMSGWDQEKAFLAFVIKGKQMRFFVPLPNKKDFELSPSGRRRTSQKGIDDAYEQAIRQRWRALALVVKAKLEAVEAGISTLEEEFLSNIMLPNGETAGQWFIPQVLRAYEVHEMPPMLPEGRS